MIIQSKLSVYTALPTERSWWPIGCETCGLLLPGHTLLGAMPRYSAIQHAPLPWWREDDQWRLGAHLCWKLYVEHMVSPPVQFYETKASFW